LYHSAGAPVISTWMDFFLPRQEVCNCSDMLLKHGHIVGVKNCVDSWATKYCVISYPFPYSTSIKPH